MRSQRLYVQIVDVSTGEIDGLIVSDGDHVVTSDKVIEIDCEAHREKLHTSIKDRFMFVGGKFVPIPPSLSKYHSFDYRALKWVLDVSKLAAKMRTRRNSILSSSDWTQLPDVPIDTKAAWASYRQDLRDITAQPGFPERISWPTPPSS